MQTTETRPTAFVGVGLTASRALPLKVAAGATLVAGMFGIVAFVMTMGQQTSGVGLPDESWFRTWTWEYDYGETIAFFRSPPLLVIGALLIAATAFGGCVVGVANAVRKAERRMVTNRWSVADEKSRLKANLKAAGWSSVGSRFLRVRIVIGVIASAVATLLSLGAPVEQGFTVGIGPTVCLVAGAVAIAGALLARPWAPLPELAVGSDGSLWQGDTSGVPVGLGPTPPVVVAPPADWYPDPGGRHELRYWDGARWTVHVSDTGARREDPEPVGAAAGDPPARTPRSGAHANGDLDTHLAEELRELGMQIDKIYERASSEEAGRISEMARARIHAVGEELYERGGKEEMQAALTQLMTLDPSQARYVEHEWHAIGA